MQPTTTVSNTASITATITTATSTTATVTTANKIEESNLPERRPSWRLRVDNGSKVCAVFSYEIIIYLYLFARLSVIIGATPQCVTR